MIRNLIFIVVVGLLVAQCFANPAQDEDKAFQAFMKKFGKLYFGKEYNNRFEIFKRNLEIAAELDSRDPHASYGVTQFMDLSPEEFSQQYLIKNFTRLPKSESNRWKPSSPPPAAYPSSYDWGSKGVVTGVYNQGQCGSCWAFSTTENIESMWAIAGHGLTGLSMQQIVDCDHVDQGCNGGNPPTAYEYVMGAGGLEAYSSYPYYGVQGPCRYNGQPSATIHSWQWITQDDDEAAMQSFTYSNGPPSICVDATIWQYYTGGVVTTASGCGTSLDHCVQLTGWSVMSGMSVWNVRNSWGTTWGPYAGYIYLEMGHNICGIGQECTSSII